MERGGAIIGKGQVLGVVVHALTPDGPLLRHVHLRRQGRSIHVLAQGGPCTIPELVALYGTRIAVSLTIDTERCVHRVLSLSGTTDDVLRQAFPGAALDQLCTSVWSDGRTTGASLARKSVVDGLVQQFHAHGFRVVQLTIGPWGSLTLRNLVNDTSSTWSVAGHRFTFEAGELTGHALAETSADEVVLGTDRVASAHALAFASGWDHLLPNAQFTHAELPEITLARKEEQARVLYERGLVLVALLFILFIAGERIIAHQLASSQATLQTSASVHAEDQEAVTALKKEVEEMEAMGTALGLDRSDGLSVQAARLAATAPTGILLDRLMEHPLRGAIKEKEVLEVDPDRVRVSGSCRNAGVLDQWISVLKNTEGKPPVKVLSYSMNTETGQPQFELELGPWNAR